MITDRKLYTVKEAAAVLRLSLSGVYELIERKLIGCYHVGARGGKKLISEKHLAEYLEKCGGDDD